jgi:hypothetical protein
MSGDSFETVFDLSSVYGGFDAAACALDAAKGVATGAVGGFLRTGTPMGVLGGAAVSGGLAAAQSVNCGDGTHSPIQMLGEGIARTFEDQSTAGAGTYG